MLMSHPVSSQFEYLAGNGRRQKIQRRGDNNMAALPLANCFKENIERKSVLFSSKQNLVKLTFNFFGWPKNMTSHLRTCHVPNKCLVFVGAGGLSLKHCTFIQCCFNVGPASQTLVWAWINFPLL